MTFAVIFLVFYCQDRAAIVINVVAYGFCAFWIQIAYERELGIYEICITVFAGLILLTAELAIEMVRLKIDNLYKKLAISN